LKVEPGARLAQIISKRYSMDKVVIFLAGNTTLRVDGLLLATGVGIFLIGAVLLYKRGFWPWLPLSLSGILLVVLAILAKLSSL
jgi:hypothetical protein